MIWLISRVDLADFTCAGRQSSSSVQFCSFLIHLHPGRDSSGTGRTWTCKEDQAASEYQQGSFEQPQQRNGNGTGRREWKQPRA